MLSLKLKYHLNKTLLKTIVDSENLINRQTHQHLFLVLSKIGTFKGLIRIKPDLSIEERSRETVLLKQHWSLIQRGVERKRMRKRNGALFADNEICGCLKGLDFHRTNYNPPFQVSAGQTQN